MEKKFHITVEGRPYSRHGQGIPANVQNISRLAGNPETL
jgi:hypothetical protein